MIGAIIGDIAGSRFEFTNAPEKGFKLYTNDCDFTDDTICTVAIADAILNGKDYKTALLEWCRRYPEPMGGYGNRFYNWINADNPEPNNSCGNGSAMRVSPVGWLFDDIKEIAAEAKRTAEVSHNHPEGIKGAQCVATVIYWLRTQRVTKRELAHAVEKRFGYEIPSLDDVYRIGREGHFDATCQETVPMAIRCFIESDSFEDAIRKAIKANGDTDTKADITGAIAEAYYDIPDELIDEALTFLPDEMIDIVDEFYNTVASRIGKKK